MSEEVITIDDYQFMVFYIVKEPINKYAVIVENIYKEANK